MTSEHASVSKPAAYNDSWLAHKVKFVMFELGNIAYAANTIYKNISRRVSNTSRLAIMFDIISYTKKDFRHLYLEEHHPLFIPTLKSLNSSCNTSSYVIGMIRRHYY